LDKKPVVKIRFEIKQIDNLLKNAAPLISILKLRNPDFVELSAAGSVLHSFYNGIENIFIMILKTFC
jgi:hypothetical protein